MQLLMSNISTVGCDWRSTVRQKQATLIGGGGGILKYPSSEKFAENTPSKFWEIFLKNREKRRKLG